MPAHGSSTPAPDKVALAAQRPWAVPRFKEFNILAAFLALCTLLAVSTPNFLTQGNIFGVMRAFSLTATCRPPTTTWPRP